MHRIKDFLPKITTVVVKIGTNLLADKVHGINIQRIDSIAGWIVRIQTIYIAQDKKEVCPD